MSKRGSQVKKHGPGRPRDDERELRNEAILEAATAVFLEQGFARASTDEIARRAGASKQTLYSLYPSWLTCLGRFPIHPLADTATTFTRI
ncbi:MAG: helix-turn-helix transcriptional regulator [Chroococcidiopsidaceae cyanobacterium CP_BM_RX_35]|nr:helix-turn-helix transcriptional regulator [Chroococcidiopsidaceae cyanobacterium CP_BM_RX_35]